MPGNKLRHNDIIHQERLKRIFDNVIFVFVHGEVIKKYEEDLIKSLTPSELKEYEYLRKKSQSFDHYVASNLSNHSSLTPTLKYNHQNETNDIFSFNSLRFVALTAGLALSSSVVSAISGAVGALKTALASLAIPLVWRRGSGHYRRWCPCRAWCSHRNELEYHRDTFGYNLK